MSTGAVVVAERNLSPLPTVTLDNSMLDPPEMRFLGFESAIRGDLLVQEVAEDRRFSRVLSIRYLDRKAAIRGSEVRKN